MIKKTWKMLSTVFLHWQGHYLQGSKECKILALMCSWSDVLHTCLYRNSFTCFFPTWGLWEIARQTDLKSLQSGYHKNPGRLVSWDSQGGKSCWWDCAESWAALGSLHLQEWDRLSIFSCKREKQHEKSLWCNDCFLISPKSNLSSHK